MAGVREMKRVLLLSLSLVILCLLVISPVMSADVKDYKKANYKYTEVAFADDFVKYIKQFIGFEIKGGLDVKINDITVAIIPADSKFAKVEIHEECLPYQYGTDAWYKCEVPDEEKEPVKEPIKEPEPVEDYELVF